MAPKTAKSARSCSAVMSAGRFATNTTRRHAGWKDVAEPERWCLDGGAVSVGNRRRGGAGTQLDEVWKAKPKSTKENTRTTKGSEDGRHKHLRKQNISCQKENKSLETIVFSAETNVLRKRLKQHEKNKHSTPMVERFIFPEETKVCLRVCFQWQNKLRTIYFQTKVSNKTNKQNYRKKGLFWRVSN